MAVTVVGQASAAATSVAFPAHQAGDLLLVFARGTAAAPSIPTAGGTVPAWTTIQSGLANSIGLTAVGFVATGAGHTTGVFTNATHIAVLVLRPGAGNRLVIAAARSSVGNGNNTQTIVYPALTFSTLSGSSFGVRVGTRTVAVTAVGTAPSGWTNQTIQPAGASALMSVHTRAGVTANPAADSVSTAGTNAAYRAVTVEVQEGPLAQSVSVAGVASAQVFVGATIPQSVLIGSVYPSGYVRSITNQVVSGDGHLVGGQRVGVFGSITASFVTNQTKPVGGVASAQAFGSVTPKTVITRAVTGVGSAQAFGSATPKAVITRAVTGIASAQAFGAISLTAGGKTLVVGLPSAQSFSTITIISGGVTSPNAGVASAAAFGVPKFKLTVALTGLASAQAFGPLTIPVALAGIPSAQAFGAITAKLVFRVTVAGVGSPAAFGVLKAVRSMAVPGLDSAQGFGALRFKLRFSVLGVGSAQLFAPPGAFLVFNVWIRPADCLPLTAVPAPEAELVLVGAGAQTIDLDPARCE